MNFEIEHRGSAGVVRLSGRLAVGAALTTLRDGVESTLMSGTRLLVLDLSLLDYLDSAGLGAVVACRRLVHAAGGRLAVAAARGKVHDLMTLTRIDQLVEVYDTVDAALAEISPEKNP